MKIVTVLCMAAAVVSLSASAWAGEGCCAAGKARKSGGDATVCSKVTAGLNLTEEQKARLTEIETACQAAGGTPEACAKSREEIRGMLTDDQKAQFDAAWEKMSKKGGSCG